MEYSVKRNVIDEREAGRIAESKLPGLKADAAIRFGNGFVVSMKKDNGETLYDSMFAVSSDGSKVAGFSPESCMEEFQKALSNVVKL